MPSSMVERDLNEKRKIYRSTIEFIDDRYLSAEMSGHFVDQRVSIDGETALALALGLVHGFICLAQG